MYRIQRFLTGFLAAFIGSAGAVVLAYVLGGGINLSVMGPGLVLASMIMVPVAALEDEDWKMVHYVSLGAALQMGISLLILIGAAYPMSAFVPLTCISIAAGALVGFAYRLFVGAFQTVPA